VSEREAITRRLNLAIGEAREQLTDVAVAAELAAGLFDLAQDIVAARRGEARGDTFREEIAEPLAFAHALVSAAAVVAAGLVPS
jgi:hypothetical protein